MNSRTIIFALAPLFICVATLPTVGTAQKNDDPWPDLPASLNGILPEPTGGFIWREGAENRIWHNCINIDPRLKENWKPENFFDDPQVIKLCDAIFDGDVEEMERLIKDGTDVNAKGDCGMNPLYWAFHLKTNPRPFGCLMKHGADPNVIVDMSARDEIQAVYPGYSVTNLTMRGVYNRHFKTVFENGGDPNLTNQCPSKNWQGPAFFEIWSDAPDYKERLKLLIACGADLNKPTPRGVTFLMANCVDEDKRCALALIAINDGGADYRKTWREDGGDYDGCYLRIIHNLAIVKSIFEGKYPNDEHPNFQKLVARLEELGESMDEAEADLVRWRKWKQEGRMDLIEEEHQRSKRQRKLNTDPPSNIGKSDKSGR